MTSKFRILLRKAAEQLGLFDMPVQVDGYTRDDGTYVAPHTSRRHKRLGGDKQAAPRKQAEQVDLLTGVGPPEKAPEKPASHQQWPAIVEHVTRKGKTLRGVIVFGITKEQAEGVDPGTFMKDGGWFLREKRMRAAHAEDRAPRWLPRLPAEQVEPADKKESRRPIARPLNGAEGADGGLFGADQEARKEASERLDPFGVAPGTSKADRRRLNAAAAARADELMAGRSTPPDLSPEDAALLRQYTGTGGIGDSLNEFYTRQDVANAMWSVVGKLVGDAPSRVLEPCCGTGVFLHTAPAGAHVTGVEMDATSGQIATLLHQQHQVRVAPFEDFATGDDRQFDAVIGNVPFGLRGALIKKDKSDLKTAEQYFVDAALDKTRAGGVVALIVPTGIMDGKNSRSFRERILKKGEFVTAFRMPNTAFEAAHTEVTTDIVVFRKRPDDVAGALSTVDRKTMESLGLWDKEFVGGSFFQGRGVDHVFGRPEEGWRAKAGMGNDFTVTGSMDGVAAAIADWAPPEGNDVPELSVASVLDALGDDEDAKRRARGAALKVPYRMGRIGDTKVVDGILYVLQGEPPRWHRADDDAKFVSDARSLAQALETLADTAAAGRPADALRDHAKELLDAYIAEHGDPHKSKELTDAARSYPEIWRLLGAVKKNGGGYSDLVTRRDSEREEKTDSFAGAVARAMGEGEGSDSFTPEAVAAQWAGGDIQAAMDHLMADDAYAADPATGAWQTRDNYLSGDLYAKLDAVREALDREDLDAAFRAKYEAQAKALEEAIDPQSLEDVEAQINSGWVPLDVVADFFTSRNAESDSEYVRNLEPISITFENGVFKVTGGGYNLGLISKYLNRTGLREDDQPVIDGWNEQFKEWLLTSRHRDRVEDAYNRAFRAFRAKTFSDRPMEVPGLNPEREVNAYHWPSMRWALSEGKGIIADDVGLGKAQPLDAKILTPTGWVMMGDIKVGDLVIAGDGSPAKVLGVYPQGDKEIFRVSFSDGAATECCEEHLWLTQTYYERNNARRSLSGTGGGKVRPLSEIAKSLRQAGKSHPDGVRNHAIPMVGPVQFAPREVPIDPYLLGVLIGDGCLCHGTPRVSTPDAWIVDEIGRMLPAGVVISKAVDNGRCPEYRLSKAARTFDGNGHNAKNPLKQEIERLGLNVKSEHKFVPDAYLFNSVSARLSMLQGLMDTDGYVCKAGVTVQFSSSSRRLADDVVFLVNSLGGNATMASKIPTFRNTKGEKAEGLEHYTVHMRLPPGIAPFRLPKKADRVRPKSKYLPVRYVEKVESVGMKPAQCIMVDHPSHLYVTDDFIVTHNTLRGLMLARLLKTNGQAKKPLTVVPKSVLANWVAEAEAWFPGARVMVIGETYTRDKNGELVGKVDSAAERNRKLHEFAQNDYDFAFISMPAWSEIDLSPEKKNEYINNDFWTQRADQLDQAGDKRMRKIREAYEQQVAGRDFEKRTDALYFDDLGVDALIIDEGHNFKNLYAARSRFGESPKFLGGQGLSNRALDTNLKSQQVREANGGKGVFMLTATPTKNSPLEIYSMLSHIAPEEFIKRGIKNSEEFLDRYCVFEKDKVLGVNGEIEDALVTAGFKNMDELRAIMSRYIQRRTAEDVGLPLPRPEADMVLVDMSPAQKAVYVELREAAAKAGGADDTGDAHIFSIMDKMGKAAIDLRLLDHAEPDVPSPKLVKAADVIAEGAKEGGQVVFADHIDLHERLVDMLVDRGLKRSEIGIVNAKAASSSAKRQNIQDQFNSGKLKVVIGNTATMGEGMNLQKRTSDIHHLELPWEPASIQQRNGRGLRQGNKREAVRIHTYLSKGSFDGYRYQTLTAKRDWQDLLWKGGNRIENLAREGVFDRNDLMIMLSADPDAERAKVAADKEAALGRAAAEGRAQAAGEFARFAEMTRSMKNLPAGSKSSGRLEARIEAARARLKANPHFAAKAALDNPDGVFVHPSTGHAWRAGVAFEIDPKVAEAAKYSERASRWLVTSVKPGEGRLRARPYGSNTEFEFNSKLLSEGITPTDYDKAADSKATAEVLAGQVGGPEMNTPEKLVGLDPGMLRERYHDIQAALKEALRTYKAHISDRAALVKDGKPLSVKSYEVNQNLDSADLMLPIPEHRDLAIQAWVDAERAKRPAGKYPATGRRSSYHGGAPIGVEFSYGPLETRNPWEGALKDLFGKESIEEARDKLVTSAIAEAKDLDFIGALKVLSSTVRQEPYSTKASWPAESVAALLDKATPDDLTAQIAVSMSAAGLHSGVYTHGVPSESQPSNSDHGGWALAKMAIGGGDYALAVRAIQAQGKASGADRKATLANVIRLENLAPPGKRAAMQRVISEEGLKMARQAGIDGEPDASDPRGRTVGEVLERMGSIAADPREDVAG